MTRNERIRIAALVVVLAIVGVAGEVTGGTLDDASSWPAVQAATIGGGSDAGGAMTTAVWTMQLVGILLFELWAFGRRRESHEGMPDRRHDSPPATNRWS